ncbi:LacI family DNA-binding transcriptional regulator [Paenibacillus mendelii]|uniref:LacI family DNA-binding transcriptional regulator n=1 Tax=Paenibacillus mendelii TaxID=206163 RepID=A0ABV6J5S3_9BACL|nr:LacI family DNA-binding transcriptional regulator [Paenibacillus mendelii]MCQ6560076.1 LacI family transcriptional regulator [Paenibacillus mendelii]
MKRPITIHDIAKLAEVSSATVSRVLSGSDYPVSAATREKIQRIAKESNYIPNMLGKQLKTNSSMTIGVIIPSISNPFYSSVILGIEGIARQKGFHVIVCNSLHDAALEQEYLKTIAEKQVKGLIISSIGSDQAMLQKLMDTGMKVIAIDQKVDGEGISQIEFDYRKGGYMATKHLQSMGHRKIGYVTSQLDRPSRRSIYQGYEEAMRELDLEPLTAESAEDDVYNSLNEFNMGKKLAGKLLEAVHPPTAIFACNDVMAFGVINELSLRGLQVPRDMSVIGFDGIEYGQMIHPPLTTIKQPDYEMGRMACSMLLDLLNGETKPVYDVVLQPQLLERSSVADVQSKP